MTNLISDAFIQAKELVMKAMGELVADGTFPAEPVPAFNTEIPADSKNGDVSTNAAMVCARPFRNNPRKIAEAIVSKIDLNSSYFARCEVAGPGFINFFYSSEWYATVVATVLEQKEKYGETDLGAGKSVLVEFVSANPTGPMHIGNARGGAIGDCLASVLEKAGYEVAREFYINDAGNQIEKFKTSLEVRYLQIYKPETELPEDAYKGQDIIDHANAFNEIYGDKYVNADSEERRQALCDFALPKNIQKLHDDLGKYRIQYDKWFNESTLHKDGSVQRVIEQLKASGHTYEKDGALWFKTTEFGDEKDRVLVRENGVPTYLVPDIAYHYNKLAVRKFDKAVDIFGADHHGYIARIKASMTALGVDADRLDIVIMQMVNLVRNGEKYKLSKRSGKAITLSTLLDEIPIDAARFFFNLREPNSHFDFDLDLAVSQTSQNPVYYVQYAHARICSVLKKMNEEGIEIKSLDKAALNVLTAPEEQEMIKHLATLPNVINEAAKAYDPAKVTKYVIDLATMYHKFYNNCRIMGEDESVMQARLSLSLAVKQVIKNILDMLKITCPESM
ncbi:arginine--tRNA ligase [Ruminococcus bicirculans (ex Wegman et al. 2014)]|uniref:Arginine--tRNA ligase n=1 Tax=Ruminococcus bicirculans (ex Wegman et al. 2014) TaxID=1160721 RepID=A0AAW6E1C9_9FIRM|nr:arginine--tRNA ligase [Ruminococcus bicirculans (ex Wegman et al. 2014)]MDB8736430.1 arginine--tRNA ligase [Ruminococcus bicirculans (ex Wegman et al. 2014)]MDB8742250.1 arginine--tRNA ligase [Ruminococcus bicirculans (ex Wegman et al. 2014)]